MRRTWTILGVVDVEISSRWYLQLFGKQIRPPDHDDFDLICDDDGTVLLGLHEWGGHDEGPPLRSPADGASGNGVLLFFRVDDYDACLARARTLVGALHTAPHLNPSTGTMDFTVRDPDGYYVTLSATSQCQEADG